jgi:hypothetical protein
MQSIRFPRLSATVAVVVLLSSVPAAHSHGGDPAVARFFAEAYTNAAINTPFETTEAVTMLVDLASAVHGETGEHLLPPGVTVERAEWVGNIVEIDLTLNAAADEIGISPLDVETLDAAFQRPFIGAADFGGTRVRVRPSDADAYQLLETIVPHADPADFTEREADEDVMLVPFDEQPFATNAPVGLGGSQPPGALTGVTVYISAGHGWTAGSSSPWFLQRPVLLGMAEDYGNIDQINLVCQYLFNAGATVVPLRPAGWQPLEIVLDQDDPEVTYTGGWTPSTAAPYYEQGRTLSGVSYEFANTSAVEDATARFTPTITVSDYYPVYCWALASGNRVNQLYRVGHSGGVTEVRVDHTNVGNGWVWLGDYYLEAGGDNYVEISNAASVSGVVIADAIRWGGGFGDIVRPGPGSTSGYPRDEEAQRYWAESEFGNNAVGFSSGIWDLSGSSDNSDNVGTGARVAREMNRVPPGGSSVDRWKRVHVEFHSNAFNSAARGQVCLITGNATTNQISFANILSDEFDADMSFLSNTFEHPWVDRSSPTLTGAYGAISTTNNGDEFDSTLIEVAFHDNQQDAELLRDVNFRAASARATVHGVIRFLNTLPGSQVALNFAPDVPRYVNVEDLGGGDVRVSWFPPLSDGARGEPATSYVVYQSPNGKGFGNPIDVGGSLSATIGSVPVGETRYYAVAARNAGGESPLSEVVAVRRPQTGVADILIVNGFERADRTLNPSTDFSQPAAYAGLSVERQLPRATNNFDYVIQHAEALGANDYGFASCDNDSVRDGVVDLANYTKLVWILGPEENATFDSAEQFDVQAFVANGGSLFVSGSQVAWDLIGLNNGPSFATTTLRIGLGADDAGSFIASGATGSIFNGVANLSFTPSGAPYSVYTPDRLLAGSGAVAALNYIGGSGGIAATQYAGGTYNAVVFGFPFETINSASVRADVMNRVITYLDNAADPLPFDQDGDGDVDIDDFNFFQFCMAGPDNIYAPGTFCLVQDGDEDGDVDSADAALFQTTYTGPLP